jgi:hypothetical protein
MASCDDFTAKQREGMINRASMRLTAVSAIREIKAKYQVRKNWMGDPCAPKAMAWDRLTCSYGAIGSRPRITSV